MAGSALRAASARSRPGGAPGGAAGGAGAPAEPPGLARRALRAGLGELGLARGAGQARGGLRHAALGAQRLVEPRHRRAEARAAGQRGAEALLGRRGLAAAQRDLAQQHLRIGRVLHLAAGGAAGDLVGLVEAPRAQRGARLGEFERVGRAVQRPLPLRGAGGIGRLGLFEQAAGLGRAPLAQPHDAKPP
jgi:hypothetical protein